MGVVKVTPQNAAQTPNAVAWWTWGRQGQATPGVQLSTEGDADLAGDVIINNLLVTGTATGPFGGGSTVTWTRGRITTGDVDQGDTAGAWAAVAGITFTSPTAVAGDVLDASVSFMFEAAPAAGHFYDMAIVVAGTPVVYSSSGTNTPALEGDPSLYRSPETYRASGWTWNLEVTAPMISAGAVTFQLYGKGGAVTNSTIFASANYPFRWRVGNYGS